jgi:predicted cobalt transporter CbtA
MEWCPTPGVVRNPCVTIVGHCPVAVSGVGVKVVPHIGNPYTSVIAVVDPSSVRSQFIVEDVETDTAGVIVITVIIITIVSAIIVVVLTLRICASGSVA